MNNREFFEELLAYHCAPTLCKFKIANMFYVDKSLLVNIEELVQIYNKILNSKGINIRLFQSSKSRVTVFVFSILHLGLALNQNSIQQFLSFYGYRDFSINGVFDRLEYRLDASTSYPHEIGILLGYPLEDVKGFINSDSCKMVGAWKVYSSNLVEAKKKFTLYDSLRDFFVWEIENGTKLINLIH